MKKDYQILFLFVLISSIKTNAQTHWHMYAIRDSAVTFVNTPVVIHVLSNDSLIPEPNSIFYLLSPFACDYPYFQGTLSSFNGGTLLFLNNDSIKYTPPLNFIGTDRFIYGICDNGGTYQYDSASVFIKVKSITTGLDKTLKLLNLNITPNPCKDKLKIDISNYEKSNYFDVIFINILGETIKKDIIESSSTIINTEDLNTGIYSIYIRDKNGYAITRKIIIE